MGFGRPASRLAHQHQLHVALEELLLLDPLVLAIAPTNGRDLRSRPNQLLTICRQISKHPLAQLLLC